MSGYKTTPIIKHAALAAAVLFGASHVQANDAQNGTAMTAGVVLKKMPVRERTSYIAGIVDGLAHARFRKDSAASGQNDTTGMKCIYDWFYADSMSTLDRIEAAFNKYQEHYPSTLVYVMTKKACGE